MKLLFTDTNGNKSDKIPAIDNDLWVLALDGSTARSGVCLMSVGGRLGFVCAVVRGSESVVEYKLALKKILTKLITHFDIRYAAYEEPFIGYAGDVKGLYMIASTLEEIAAETALPLTVTAVNNKRWKKQFTQLKIQGGRDVQKKLVFDKAVSLVPGLASCRDDETDAFGLASYLARCIREDALDSMASKGKPRKFGYGIVLQGGRINAEEALKIVGKPLADGVIIADISTKRSFDSAVYELMQGKNAILLLHFKAGKFGNILLEHDGGDLAAQHEVLSAVVTRNKRMRSTPKKTAQGSSIQFM